MESKRTYQLVDFISAVFLILTLLWLTVSTPFIFEAQKEINRTHTSVPPGQPTEDSTNPFSGLNEEKSSEISLSEYLHDGSAILDMNPLRIAHADADGADIYIAFYGELLSPPPECSSLMS